MAAEPPAFVVRLTGAPGVGKSALAAALLEMPMATDDELTRLAFVEDDVPCDARIVVVRGAPAEGLVLEPDTLVAVHARDLGHDANDDEAMRDAWSRLASPERVHLTQTPPDGSVRGVDALRASILETALLKADLPVDRVRRAKRPYALAVIAGATMVTAAEAFLPGAAAFIVASQASAISSLFYLYTGRWMGRTQALALLPAFVAEAAGGSIFLLVKSFFPPTGVGDVVAAGVAASMTVTVLGTIAWALDQGYSLEETEQLRAAFKKLRARTKAERRTIAANRHRWKDKAFWVELARRVVFPR